MKKFSKKILELSVERISEEIIKGMTYSGYNYISILNDFNKESNIFRTDINYLYINIFLNEKIYKIEKLYLFFYFLFNKDLEKLKRIQIKDTNNNKKIVIEIIKEYLKIKKDIDHLFLNNYNNFKKIITILWKLTNKSIFNKVGKEDIIDIFIQLLNIEYRDEKQIKIFVKNIIKILNYDLPINIIDFKKKYPKIYEEIFIKLKNKNKLKDLNYSLLIKSLDLVNSTFY